ncbi:MAG: methyltransferase domain-containing protein [Nanoarchaeota archaeon]|nr:methyltransferase domain-containing protein [Nanoarchaeota archaeon]
MVDTDSFKQQIDPFIKAVMRKLPIDATIGEIGCGAGSTIKLLTPHQHWYGADTNKEVLRQIKANTKSEKVHVRYGAVSPHLDFPDNGCDILFCLLKVHMIDNLREALAVLLAKASYGGKIIIVDFSDVEKSMMRRENNQALWKECDLEELLRKYRGFAKHILNDRLVAYEIVKA